MCGIAGFLQPAPLDGAQAARLATAMGERLLHRGPDDGDRWIDADAGMALAHRRLAIIDLSPAGRQPMSSACGRYVIAFNGEIYNHMSLRPVLPGVPWRGQSDTETLLEACAAWGVDKALRGCVGMFAFALWDRQARLLVLARDRFGEKPLYYGHHAGVFLFASELKALKAHPAFTPEIDRGALALQLRHNHIPAPYSIYRGIRKLLPGTYVTVPARTAQAGEPTVYWSTRDVAERGQAALFAGSPAEAEDELDARLREATRLQMVADVPLGAFLSGGIDSSLITSLMQAQSARPVKTFTIGFEDKAYNEAEHAHAVARHLGTEHTELMVTGQQALDVIARLPQLYDEPFSDSSQIPTFLVAQMTRRHVTVALSGDAGDELFGGYNRYHAATRLMHRLAWMPMGMRRQLGAALSSAPVRWWDGLARLAGMSDGAEKARKVVEIITAPDQGAVYRRMVSHWKAPAEVVLGTQEPTTLLSDASQWPRLEHFVHQMMAMDTMSYLPDDILVKVDRAAMGVSLETRVPLLDHRIAEFAWSLPLSLKVRGGQGKWLLRRVLDRYVPRSLTERPKKGFAVPLQAWLRGPLREWTEHLLDESRLRQEGYFDPAPIRQKWAQHLSGQRDWHYYLWDVLMFQAWLASEREQQA